MKDLSLVILTCFLYGNLETQLEKTRYIIKYITDLYGDKVYLTQKKSVISFSLED